MKKLILLLALALPGWKTSGQTLAACAKVTTGAELSKFAGQPYQAVDANTLEPFKSAEFRCYYATSQGPGERVVRISIATDEGGRQFKDERANPWAGERVEAAKGVKLGEDAFFVWSKGSKGLGNGRLVAYRAGKRYSVLLPLYGGEPATRKMLLTLMERLLTVSGS